MTALNTLRTTALPALVAPAPLEPNYSIESLSMGMPGYQVVADALRRAEPSWSFDLDALDVHSCPIDELRAMHASAPSLCLRGFLSGILSGRAELALLTGRSDGQPTSSSGSGDPDFDLKARLERRFRRWASELDGLHLFSSPTKELKTLLDQAPHEYYAGFLAGVLSMRANISFLTGRKGC